MTGLSVCLRKLYGFLFSPYYQLVVGLLASPPIRLIVQISLYQIIHVYYTIKIFYFEDRSHYRNHENARVPSYANATLPFV